ncbi:hypothetical protein OPQ81_003673 [Rhizoctonia solani]|nr:hypothetical protein OPQ81_003673 [Rhizoctonia solani]
MRVSVVVAALATVASASSLGKRQIPSCAMTCIQNANLDGCSATDNTCLCKSEKFVQSTYSCIAGACQGKDLDTAVAAANALCIAAGVTLTNTVPASTGASATATSPATGTATSTATPTSSSNGAITFSGSPMVGALAAVAGVVFAL